MSQTRYLTFGDRGLIVEFGNDISPEINEKVRSIYLGILKENLPEVIALNPTYRSLLVEYEPTITRFQQMVDKIKGIESQMGSSELPKPNIFEVPTLYGGEYGPDIATVAASGGLTHEEVVSVHSGHDYLVYMLGFTPGFSYLGGLDDRLVTPRLESPRVTIPGGSVGIAGAQTGFYSIDSPGGWQLIGRSPIKIYDPQREIPIFQKTGDYIRFVPLTLEEYQAIEGEVAAGTYEYRYYPKEEGV